MHPGIDAAGVVEKGELVSKARAAEASIRDEETRALAAAGSRGADGVAGAGGAVAGGPASASASAPPPLGFSYEPSTGYYSNAESSMRWDAASGAFHDGQRWLRFDERLMDYVPLE